MVRNYKWNIELEKGKLIAQKTIIDILKESEREVKYSELIDLLNLRTKYLNLKNNNKRQLMTNFLKSNFKGTLNFIESLDDVFLIKKNNNNCMIVSFNNRKKLFHEFDEWCFINSENIES